MIKNYFMEISHKWPVWSVAAAVVVVYFCIKAIDYGIDKLCVTRF